MGDIVDFPPELELDLLAEGAANIVYRMNIPYSTGTTDHSTSINGRTSTPPPSYISPPSSPTQGIARYEPFRKHLLRLHKAVPWITSYEALFHEQEAMIAPHFPASQVTHQQLTRLPPGLLAKLNDQLRTADENGSRPQKRRGLYLDANEAFGLLIEDMTPDPLAGQLTLELKPKWLVQSPTAPKDSKRCRTCALTAKRTAEGKPEPPNSFCPLFLTADPAKQSNSGKLEHAARKILVFEPSDIIQKYNLTTHLTTFFTNNALLANLATLQATLDPSGVLSLPEEAEYDASLVPPEFLVATTIRDCTLFIRLTTAFDAQSQTHGIASVEAKLGDLDLKAPDSGKLGYWKSNEEVLITGGWYQARDGRRVGCLLED